MSRDITSLRREAERLRSRAGSPTPREVLAELQAPALRVLIVNAKEAIRAQALEAHRLANPPTLSDFLGEDLLPEELPHRPQAVGPVLDLDELLQLDDSPQNMK